MKFANLIKNADLDSLAKLWRKLGNAKIDLTPIMQSPAKFRNFQVFVEAGFPKIDFTKSAVVEFTLPEGEELARLILGDDFISVEEIVKAYGFQYTDAQLEHLARTLPTDMDTLQSTKADDCMLIPGPPSDMTLLGVRDLDNQLFCSKTGGWYSKDKEKFARTDLVKAGQWLIIRKSPIANSKSKNWDEQQDMIESGNRVPNAPEMSYAVTVYYKVRNVYLLGNVYVRTSSVDADGHHVSVGDFDSGDLRVCNYWHGTRDSDVGVSSARE